MGQQRFNLGDKVFWTSQAQGSVRFKRGKIVAVVPKGKQAPIDIEVDGKVLRTPEWGYHRDHESYIVLARKISHLGERTPPLTIYWPRVSALHRDPGGNQPRLDFAPGAMDGAARCCAERARQKAVEGYTPEHDDQHRNGELLRAANYYMAVPGLLTEGEPLAAIKEEIEFLFPAEWHDRFKKRQGFPEPTDRDIEKGCALAMAELDRRKRAREGK